MTVNCPICKEAVEFGVPDFPFCSERCRLFDIGHWADEEYRIPAASSPEVVPGEPPDAEDTQENQ